MEPLTVGYNKTVEALCIQNDGLSTLERMENCLSLLLLYRGSAWLEVNGVMTEANAPCFVCLDEACRITVLKTVNLQCDSIYFKPTYLNVNLTFARLRDNRYEEIASVHDFFLLCPFTDVNRSVFPVQEDTVSRALQLFADMKGQMDAQTDWYWSCRSRSAFMQILFLLERAYSDADPGAEEISQNEHTDYTFRKACRYIENTYSKKITLHDIAASIAVSPTTLNQSFRREAGTTPMSYLWEYRIRVAKRMLEFTNLPLKEIASRCGFCTVSHFCRRFEESTCQSPTAFRENALQKRRELLQNQKSEETQ